MKPFVIPREYQQKYSQRFSEECEKITMSWSNELKRWHPIALVALDFASVHDLQIPVKKYKELFNKQSVGLNMNVVAALANNLENRTPHEMSMRADEWAEVIALNDEVGRTWTELGKPVHKKLEKEFEIMMNKPKLIVAGQA